LFLGDYTLVFRPFERAKADVVHLSKEKEPCGTSLAVCAEGLVCESTVETLDTPICSPPFIIP
jgi:hypothetical protein